MKDEWISSTSIQLPFRPIWSLLLVVALSMIGQYESHHEKKHSENDTIDTEYEVDDAFLDEVIEVLNGTPEHRSEIAREQFDPTDRYLEVEERRDGMAQNQKEEGESCEHAQDNLLRTSERKHDDLIFVDLDR
jgi:hypothetical protein